MSRTERFPPFDAAFVGRKRELSTLGAALQRARSGSGSVVLVSGEAGTGKTLLVSEFSAFARAAGAKVLEGRANVQFCNVPFGVWKQILSHPPSPLEASSAEVLPAETRPALPVAPLRPCDDEIISNLPETTARALIDQARTPPLVVVLDDLHAADPMSLEVFRILARDLSHFGTLLIGVYRDSEIRRFQAFHEWLLDPMIRDIKRISLDAFDCEETRQFAQSRSANPLREGTLTLLRSLTGGNPRLLEIALRRNLAEEPGGGSQNRLGGLLRAEIEAHLEHLSASAREVLSVAAVAGVEFGLTSLFHVIELDPKKLLDSLYEAEQSGLLKRTEMPGTYRFQQALMQEILYGELTGANRARLHKRFGEVLASLHRCDPVFVERIAAHFYEAAVLGCSDKAAEYCARAAAYAYSESRIADGLRFYRMALVALELQGPNPDPIRELQLLLEKAGFGRNLTLVAEPDAADRAETAASQAPSPVSPGKDHDPSPKVSAAAFRGAGNRNEIAGQDEFAAQPGAPDSPIENSKHGENIFRREGDFWTLVFDHRTLRLKHSNGLLFVASLLRHPDREFHAAQLVAMLPSARANHSAPVYLSHSEKERAGIQTISARNANPLLDLTAKAEYRRRIEELRDAIDDAKALNDSARTATLEKELDFVSCELSRAVGAGGRDREHRGQEERARVNVTNAIRVLTTRIAKEHPEFGRYLRLTIRTGRFCSYRPDPVARLRWRF